MVGNLRVKIFADTAQPEQIASFAHDPMIKGFTTNPSLMRKAHVGDYRSYARDVLAAARDLPVSFEVTVDDPSDMLEQGRELASWGDNIYVKIPVTNSRGVSTNTVIQRLASRGIKVNITAVFTISQVHSILGMLYPETPSIISVFAGRIADTGVDPVPHMQECAQIIAHRSELLWASTRELLNIYHAGASGCDIITVPPEILHKRHLVGKDLTQYSRETVQSFLNDWGGYHKPD